MSTRSLDDLPLSGLLPSRAGVNQFAIVTVVTALGFLLTAVPDLLNFPVQRQVYGEVVLPVHVAYAYHVVDALRSAMPYSMWSAPIIIVLLLRDFSPLRRFVAGAVGGFLTIGFFNIFDGLEDAIWQAYVYRGGPEPSVAYYLSEAWGGFIDGGFAALFGVFFIALPVFLVLVATERWTRLELLQ